MKTLNEIKTHADLIEWHEKYLVVRDIEDNILTGNKRAVALFKFEVSLQFEEIKLIVGVYDLDENGNPISSKSVKPYEDIILATNHKQIDISDPNFEIVEKEDQIEGKTYIGEFDAYVYITKNNPIKLWDLFYSVIKKSKTINLEQ